MAKTVLYAGDMIAQFLEQMPDPEGTCRVGNTQEAGLDSFFDYIKSPSFLQDLVGGMSVGGQRIVHTFLLSRQKSLEPGGQFDGRPAFWAEYPDIPGFGDLFVGHREQHATCVALYLHPIPPALSPP